MAHLKILRFTSFAYKIKCGKAFSLRLFTHVFSPVFVREFAKTRLLLAKYCVSLGSKGMDWLVIRFFPRVVPS